MIDKTNRPDEILDLVDENDRIIGEVRRDKANVNPALTHREVWMLIYGEKNRLLFQQRSKKKKFRPGFWAESCAGHVPKGEEPDKVAHNELREELGFDTELTFVEKIKDRRPTETRFVYFYIGPYRGEKIMLNPHEVEQVGFFAPKDYKNLLKSGGHFGGLAHKLVKRFWRGDFDSYKS